MNAENCYSDPLTAAVRRRDTVEVLRLLAPSLSGLARQVCGSALQDDAEQEGRIAVWKAVRGADLGRTDQSTRQFLVQSAVNAMVSLLRREGRHVMVSVEEVGPATTMDPEYVELPPLPPILLIVLDYIRQTGTVQGAQTYVAGRMGLSRSTASTKVHQAMKSVRSDRDGREVIIRARLAGRRRGRGD